jgi:glycosyltransferase involved in cell wall biosynthesis
MEVLPNPSSAVASDDSAPARGDHFLFVGRAVPEKGLRTMCAAALRAGADVRMAGDGPQLDELRRDFGEKPRIEFLGRLEPANVARMMREARAVLVPSEWYENQPMVILEAFAQGTPVIASNLGGNPELVRDGDTGVLHKPGDVADLASKLRWAVEHPDEMAAMGERGREFARGFSPERHLERLLDVFARFVPAGMT